jgi:hypothetical protein
MRLQGATSQKTAIIFTTMRTLKLTWPNLSYLGICWRGRISQKSGHPEYEARVLTPQLQPSLVSFKGKYILIVI